MSYRPTISIYLGGRIVDIGYYRNWNDKALFYQAIAIAAFLGGCHSREEYNARMFGHGTDPSLSESSAFGDDEDAMKWLEECLELPIIVDLSEKQIYVTRYAGAMTKEKWRRIPSLLARPPHQLSAGSKRIGCDSNFYTLLSRYRIPFGELNMREIRRLVHREPELQSFLSEKMLACVDTVGEGRNNGIRYT